MIILLRFRRYRFLGPTLYKLYLHDIGFRSKKVVGHYETRVNTEGCQRLIMDFDWLVHRFATVCVLKRKRSARLLAPILFSLALRFEKEEKEFSPFRPFFGARLRQELLRKRGHFRYKFVKH